MVGVPVVTASNASATAITLAPSGMSKPANPRGYPEPSKRSWCAAMTGRAGAANEMPASIRTPSSG